MFNNYCFLLLLIVALSGCSNTQQAQQKTAQQTLVTQQAMLMDKVESLEQDIEQWKNVAPNVQRLVAIESELTLLITQLNAIIAQAEKKEHQKNSAITQINAPKNPINSTNRNYAVQLASINDPTVLPSLWIKTTKNNPNIFKEMEPIVEKISVNQRDYYRLKAGSFGSKSEATQVCKKLKKVAVNCLISPATGEPLDY